ncbi:hypothetical protein AAVH_24868 [Aphelenchoides avenae]|nr:hypothetical protein AAVH_24868 [Aphelenchus avenae]
MPSKEPIPLMEGVTPGGFISFICWLYGKQLLLTEENWEETLAACFGLELTGTEFEERIVAFVKSKLKPEVVLACLGVCMRFKTYDTLLEQIKSKQCNDAAVRKELGTVLFKIRFAQMKPVSFASGPGRSKILTDKEKSDIYQFHFDDTFKLRGFVLVKRYCVGARDDEIIESCDVCGNTDDAFVECCDDVYLRVKQKKWSTARCPKEDCNRFAYRCRCGELCIDQADGYNSTCFGCRLTVHLCGKGVSQLRNFEKGEDCDHRGRVPVTEGDSSADSSSDSSDSEDTGDSSDDQCSSSRGVRKRL